MARCARSSGAGIRSRNEGDLAEAEREATHGEQLRRTSQPTGAHAHRWARRPPAESHRGAQHGELAAPHCLASDLSQREIGGQLYLSVNTVNLPACEHR